MNKIISELSAEVKDRIIFLNVVNTISVIFGRLLNWLLVWVVLSIAFFILFTRPLMYITEPIAYIVGVKEMEILKSFYNLTARFGLMFLIMRAVVSNCDFLSRYFINSKQYMGILSILDIVFSVYSFNVTKHILSSYDRIECILLVLLIYIVGLIIGFVNIVVEEIISRKSEVMYF